MDRLLLEEIRNSKKLTIKMLTENIEKDLKFGVKSEVYRKCNAVFLEPTVHSISIVSLDKNDFYCNFEKTQVAGDLVTYEDYVYYDTGKKNKLASIKISFNTIKMSMIFKKNLVTSVFVILCTLILIFFPFKRAIINFVMPFNELMQRLSKGEVDKIYKFAKNSVSNIKELDELYLAIKSMSYQIQRYEKEHLNLVKEEALLTQASQVAHDIRSPLTVLEMLTLDLPSIAEEKRVTIRSAIMRIKDIANDLLKAQSFQSKNNFERKVLASGVVESLLSEKRVEFRNKNNIEILSQFDDLPYGTFVWGDPKELKRVLSNLINNSVDSIDDKGKVNVVLKMYDFDFIAIEIIDDGKGIHPDLLKKLGEEAVSHGKKDGNGIGLLHAKQTMKKWEGDLIIKSELGVGTTISLIIKRVEPPSNFPMEILVQNQLPIIILDDDESIHNVWKERFKLLNDQDIQLLHFYSEDEFLKFFKGGTFQLLLIDYELDLNKRTGLDIIKSLNLAEKSILITSRYEEEDIVDECERLNIPLLPKDLSPHIPIKINFNSTKDSPNHNFQNDSNTKSKDTNIKVDEPKEYILIDDDPLIQKIWQMAAQKSGANLICFTSIAEFESKKSSIDKESYIYIDSSLNDPYEKRGEDYARELFELGFNNLYLCTGHDASHFENYSFLKGIVSKKPPRFE